MTHTYLLLLREVTETTVVTILVNGKELATKTLLDAQLAKGVTRLHFIAINLIVLEVVELDLLLGPVLLDLLGRGVSLLLLLLTTTTAQTQHKVQRALYTIHHMTSTTQH